MPLFKAKNDVFIDTFNIGRDTWPSWFFKVLDTVHEDKFGKFKYLKQKNRDDQILYILVKIKGEFKKLNNTDYVLKDADENVLIVDENTFNLLFLEITSLFEIVNTAITEHAQPADGIALIETKNGHCR